jgi:glycosyltransferase involved in cell wall biosynthesis
MNKNTHPQPLVSVCMITYNHEAYISQAIEGVIMQKTDFPFELVIGEDCSTDQTRDICIKYQQKYPNLIRVISNAQNMGMGPNLVQTLLNCNGKYIALCDGDDFWININKLQKQVYFLESNNEYVLCFHASKILTDDIKTDDFITKIPDNYESIHTLARKGNYIHTPTVVFRNIIRSFPKGFIHSPICDYFLYMILAQNGKLKYIDNIMSVYRYGSGLHSTKNELDRIKATIKLFELMKIYFPMEFSKIFSARAYKLKSYIVEKELKEFEFSYEIVTNPLWLSRRISISTIVKILFYKILHKFSFTNK